MSARVKAAAPTTAVPAGAYKASDAADDIQSALCVVNDLLRLALDELVSHPALRADSAIRGAQRFIRDICDIAERMHEIDDAAKGGVA